MPITGLLIYSGESLLQVQQCDWQVWGKLCWRSFSDSPLLLNFSMFKPSLQLLCNTNQVKDDILKNLKETVIYSATTDMWPSSNMTPYMSLRIHYLTTDWALQSKCLETGFTPENHTADTLVECLQSALADWALDEQNMYCITTDSRHYGCSRQTWPWLNYFGHNLHLAVTNTTSEKERTARALGLCRSLVNTFNLRGSPSKSSSGELFIHLKT